MVLPKPNGASISLAAQLRHPSPMLVPQTHAREMRGETSFLCFTTSGESAKRFDAESNQTAFCKKLFNPPKLLIDHQKQEPRACPVARTRQAVRFRVSRYVSCSASGGSESPRRKADSSSLYSAQKSDTWVPPRTAIRVEVFSRSSQKPIDSSYLGRATEKSRLHRKAHRRRPKAANPWARDQALVKPSGARSGNPRFQRSPGSRSYLTRSSKGVTHIGV